VKYIHLVQTWDSVASSCEHDNEFGAVKFWNLFDWETTNFWKRHLFHTVI